MSTKKTRFYKKLLSRPLVGNTCVLELINDEPHDTAALGDIRLVHTSMVTRYLDEEGEFHTLNSIYRPHATKP